jgi:hypothetical protein
MDPKSSGVYIEIEWCKYILINLTIDRCKYRNPHKFNRSFSKINLNPSKRWMWIHRETDKTLKRNTHHVSLRETIQTKKYVKEIES